MVIIAIVVVYIMGLLMCALFNCKRVGKFSIFGERITIKDILLEASLWPLLLLLLIIISPLVFLSVIFLKFW